MVLCVRRSMKYPVRGPSPIAVHSAIFRTLFGPLFYHTVVHYNGPVPYSGPRSYNGPLIMKWYTSDVHVWSFFFFFFFFFLENERKWDEEENERRSDGERSGGKWLESSKRSPKRKTGKCTAMEALGPFLSARNSVQVQLSPKKKSSCQKERT